MAPFLAEKMATPSMRHALLPIALILTSFWPQFAHAHPHVFIDNRLTFFLADGKVSGFRTDWRFDEIFTEDLLSQYDSDGDRQFSPAESEQLKAGTLPNLAAFRYFTYVYLAGKDLGKMEPADFKADITDGAARFVFTYRLPHPINPRQETIAVSIYDQEYYVEVLLAQQSPVEVEGGSAGCGAKVADDPEHAYFGGFVIPQIVTMTCQ
ncbi:DUF1007 family protein [Dongia sp.]|uniref:DUF1007 family protein n=1 Tax=Dongia sp. TaxID=1977262 RepID=UPI0035B19987